MNILLRHPSVYLAIPFWIVGALSILIFNIPEDFLPWILVFPSCAAIAVIIDVLFVFQFRLSSLFLQRAIKEIRSEANHGINQIALLLGLVVFFFCFVDVGVNGFKILNASAYTELSRIGAHVRHISNMCWILVPIAYVCVKPSWLRVVLIVSAIVFPIIFVDRNRMIQSVFCLIWIHLWMQSAQKLPIFKILLLLGALIGSFVTIGFIRSGAEAFVVPSSGTTLFENHFPLREWFLETPIFMQQILLYLAAPLFNFATVAHLEHYDPSLLTAQLFTFLGYLPSNELIPILVQRFNVGTEFFPFLLFGGITASLVAFLGMFVVLLLSHIAFIAQPNIFYLLIYLRVIYCCLMSGFAPQFYTWTNIDFILMCTVLYLVSPLFIRRHGVDAALENKPS